MLESEEEIRAKIDACPDRLMRDHWLLCEPCIPLRKMLRIRLWGFATLEGYEVNQQKYFNVCSCGETYLASEDFCVRCKTGDFLRKEIRPDHPDWPYHSKTGRMEYEPG